jgi:hypothetical protein
VANNKTSDMEDGEEFIMNVLELTSRLLISYTGWQEISDETVKFAAVSNIFRLVLKALLKVSQKQSHKDDLSLRYIHDHVNIFF